MSALKKTPGLPPEEREMQRILALPINHWPDEEDTEIASFERMHAEAFHVGERIFPRQVAGIEAYEDRGGLLAPIGVGGGKSGLALMAAQHALNTGLRKIVLLIPPQLCYTMLHRHVPEWRRRIPLSATFHMIAGKSQVVRQTICDSGATGIYIFPYSFLSTPDTMDMLEAISPELVIADEAHYLRNPQSARTKRLMYFLENSQFVGMSGTMTSKKISDYHHLSDAALGDSSPLPRQNSVAARWGQVLDVGRGGYPDAYTRKILEPLVDWAKKTTDEDLGKGVEACRRAYQRRLVTAPGVVATSDRPEASLQFRNHESEAPGPKLLELIAMVDGMETPEGEPIDHSIHTHEWYSELNSGFYYSQVWPTIDELVKNRRIEQPEAEALLHLSKIYHKAACNYHAEGREFFKESPPGLDTPREVGRAISLGKTDELPPALVATWHAMHAADFEGRMDRNSIPVRVDDFKIQTAVRWAALAKRGILWVFHREVGVWLTEALEKAGLDPLHAPAGADREIEAVGDPGLGGQGDRIVVASVRAHGLGRNLQSFCDQLYVQWPRSADLCEQAIGRTHREGQQEDMVTAHTLLTTDWDHENRGAALNDALYVQQTVSTPQRIIYGDYADMPKTYSPEFLRERGYAPKPLDRDALRRVFEG